EALAERGFAALPHDHLRLATLCALAEASAPIGDGARGALLHELLLPFRALNVQIAKMACLGSVERFLALTCVARGDVTSAVAHFEAAIAANDARGLRVPAARARIELAELTGERELLVAALAQAEAAGSAFLAERARAHLPSSAA